MSMDRCSSCDRLVDTDFDGEFYQSFDDEPLCGVCRDARGYCDYCFEVLNQDGHCNNEACQEQAKKEQASEDRHNDPRRR